LLAITAADGGVPNVLGNAVAYPRAPWWEPAAAPIPGSLLPTASIAGLLYKNHIQHAWLEQATAFVWSAGAELLERAAASGSDRFRRLQVLYEARALVVFLDHVPDRTRAARTAQELGRVLARFSLLATGAGADQEAASPLDVAVTPESTARAWFDDRVIAAELAELIASQASDGGFDVSWAIWTPITGFEWRGIQTVERLKTLRAYGRL
jgi:hypothetical protein